MIKHHLLGQQCDSAQNQHNKLGSSTHYASDVSTAAPTATTTATATATATANVTSNTPNALAHDALGVTTKSVDSPVASKSVMQPAVKAVVKKGRGRSRRNALHEAATAPHTNTHARTDSAEINALEEEPYTPLPTLQMGPYTINDMYDLRQHFLVEEAILLYRNGKLQRFLLTHKSLSEYRAIKRMELLEITAGTYTNLEVASKLSRIIGVLLYPMEIQGLLSAKSIDADSALVEERNSHNKLKVPSTAPKSRKSNRSSKADADTADTNAVDTATSTAPAPHNHARPASDADFFVSMPATAVTASVAVSSASASSTTTTATTVTSHSIAGAQGSNSTTTQQHSGVLPPHIHHRHGLSIEQSLLEANAHVPSSIVNNKPAHLQVRATDLLIHPDLTSVALSKCPAPLPFPAPTLDQAASVGLKPPSPNSPYYDFELSCFLQEYQVRKSTQMHALADRKSVV